MQTRPAGPGASRPRTAQVHPQCRALGVGRRVTRHLLVDHDERRIDAGSQQPAERSTVIARGRAAAARLTRAQRGGRQRRSEGWCSRRPRHRSIAPMAVRATACCNRQRQVSAGEFCGEALAPIEQLRPQRAVTLRPSSRQQRTEQDQHAETVAAPRDVMHVHWRRQQAFGGPGTGSPKSALPQRKVPLTPLRWWYEPLTPYRMFALSPAGTVQSLRSSEHLTAGT